jgi:hypothetical protein
MAKVQNGVQFQVDHRGESSTDVILDTLEITRPHALETLAKRGKAKAYTLGYLHKLLDLKSDRHDGYVSTYLCNKTLLQSADGRVTGMFCKKRWCVVCNRIRTAHLIKAYRPMLDRMNDRVFVTLTTDYTNKCTNKAKLSKVINEYNKRFFIVWRRLKRKHGKILAIRKTEIAYSCGDGIVWTGEHFHPHFHLIMPNDKGQANDLVNEWLKEFPNASIEANDIKIATEGSEVELFKYFAKLFDKSENGNVIHLPYPAKRMDEIFATCEGRRTIQTYGGKVKFDMKEVKGEQIILDSGRDEIWKYELSVETWTNAIGECIV